jgi:hypothetical protein
MDNIEKFKQEYMCERKPNNTALNSTGLCLLHIYKEIHKNCLWIHEQMGVNPNERLDVLSHIINQICHELEINSEKIFTISPSGRLKPNLFERYIDKNDIPKLYKDEYKIVWDRYSQLSAEYNKREEEREKERYNDSNYTFTFFK